VAVVLELLLTLIVYITPPRDRWQIFLVALTLPLKTIDVLEA